MIEILLFIAVALLLGVIVLMVVLLQRGGPSNRLLGQEAQLLALTQGQDRSERAVREEIGKSRQEAAGQDKLLRDEVNHNLRGLNDSVVKSIGEISTLQKNQLEAFSLQLAKLADGGQTSAKHHREEMGTSLKAFNDSVLRQMAEIATLQKNQLDVFSTRLGTLTQSNEQKLDALRQAVELKLHALQEDNSKKLEQMRATVDEKLQGTLEKRLGESFKLVSDRLEQVHKGLGEMATLATGVGDLKRVLTNVKTRGTWGEVQLDSLLEQVFAPDQYAKNIATVTGSRECVEFAIKFPNRDAPGNSGEPLWMPIDAKFPTEDYQRLVEATERADADGVQAAIRGLEVRVRGCAKDIATKYLNPPETTPFGIMFIPTEGLYAEIVRRTELIELIRREYRVEVAGPTTLFALLTSYQMGFRTLAIQRRSSEVWGLLATVKSEFGKFGGILEKVKIKLDQASNTIDDAARKSRTIERKLRKVQEIPATDEQGMLLGESAEAEEETAADLQDQPVEDAT